MRHALDRLYIFSAALAALALVAITSIVFVQVLFNTIDSVSTYLTGNPAGLLIPSYSMLSGYALGWATFLSLGLGFRRAVHIRVTLLESRLPAGSRYRALTLVALIGVVISALMAWNFLQLTWESWSWGDRASGLIRVPLWIPQAGMAFGLVVLLIACIDTLMEMLLLGRSEALKDDTIVGDAINE